MDVTDVTVAVIVGLLLAAGGLVTVRLARGPSTLDRAVALDALVSVTMAGIGVQTAVQGNAYYLPTLLVLSFLGFTGSVGVARFMALRDEAGTSDADESEDDGEPGGGRTDGGPAGGGPAGGGPAGGGAGAAR